MQLTIAALLTQAVLLNSPSVAPTEMATPEFEPYAIELKLIEKTNAERVRYGLKPLQMDVELMKTARKHCTWMTVNHSMVHNWVSIPENIAWGQKSSSNVISTWMNSSGHRTNMLSSGYSRIGVAAYVSSSGSIYWCQQFGR